MKYIEANFPFGYPNYTVGRLGVLCWIVVSVVAAKGIGQETKWLHFSDQITPATSLVRYEDGQWLFRDQAGEEFTTTHPLRWGSWPGILDSQGVWLTDGSWIQCRITDIGPKSLGVEHRWLDVTEIPLASVRAILFTPAASLREWMELMSQLQSLEGSDDTIFMRDGRRLKGVIDWNAAAHKTDIVIEFQVAGDPVEVSVEDIRMLAISPTLVGPIAKRRSAVQIGLEDGTLLSATKIAAMEEHVTIDWLPMTPVQSLDPPAQFFGAIRFIACDETSNVVRLDQREPASYKFLPDSKLTFPLGVNRSVYGEPLVIGRRRAAGIVPHGLSMRSSAQATYRWDRSPGTLVAEVRLAEPIEESSLIGDCVCKVLVAKDGKLIPAAEFNLSRAAGGQREHLLSVDVTGTQLIALVVEKASLGQWGDQVYWLDARIVTRK